MGVSESVNPHISYGRTFEEWEAATSANLDLWRWVNDEYPAWFKVKVVAFNRLRVLVELHKSDAVAKKSKQKMKKAKSK